MSGNRDSKSFLSKMAALSSTESSSSGGCHEGGAAGHIIAILTSKETFVKSQHSATPAQLAQFLRTMRDECLPLVRHTACPREVKRQLTKGFAYVGWDVKTNRCLRSSPPTLEQLKYMLGKCRANCEEHLAGLSDKAEPTDEELADSSLSLACTRLWELDVNRLVPGVDYEIDLQQGKKPYETGDRADKPLFKWVDQDVLVRPTWASFIALLDNYEASEGKAERVTKVELREENEFLDRNMRMPCMRYAHNFLVKHGKASASVAEFKKEVHDLWFGLYRRKCPNDSSGFEHVFVGEEDPKDGKIVGLHNWIRKKYKTGFFACFQMSISSHMILTRFISFAVSIPCFSVTSSISTPAPGFCSLVQKCTFKRAVCSHQALAVSKKLDVAVHQHSTI